jgi:3,4-dihydroxy 2-butanone 4-phosphate synthase / GTP cyclohydrolase II
VDLARLADLTPAGVICEIMNDDGTMARMPDLEVFAAEHGLKILSVADLIRYRLQTERLVRRVAEKEVVLDRTGTAWKVVVFDTTVEERQFLALVKGDLSTDEPVLTRMHAGSLVADLFSSTRFEGGSNLREAIDIIEREGRGVVVYLPTQSDLRAQLGKLMSHRDDPGRPPDPSSPIHEVPAEGPSAPNQGALRHFGLGAQILAELGVHNLRLLTNNPRKIAGIEAYGLHMVETVPLVSMRDAR